MLSFAPNWIFYALCALALFTIELLLRYGGSLFYQLHALQRRTTGPRTPKMATAGGDI